MMPVDLEVIKDDLDPWCRSGKTYYFTDRWVRKFPDDAREYYGFIPDRRHRAGDAAIKVYYTEEGELIISNCRDKALQNKIRIYMDNWYKWKKEQYRKRKTFRYPVAILVREYVSELTEDICQIRYNEHVCNIEKKRLEEMQTMVYIYTYPDVEYEVETGLETLDRLVLYLAKDRFETKNWPKLSFNEWERYYYPGVETCCVPRFDIPFIDLRYDAWLEFVFNGLPDVEALKKSLNSINNLSFEFFKGTD